jgi:transposase
MLIISANNIFMNRFRRYEPDQVVMTAFDAEKVFPAGSFERFLVDTINEIAIDDFYDHEDKGGETPFDPRAMLGIIFYSFSLSIYSSRKMSTMCEYHQGFQYISGFNTPDYSTICNFIKWNGKAIKEIFKKILYIAQEAGYLDYKMIATDGTKIKANASKAFRGTLEDFRKRERKLANKIEEVLEKQRNAESDEEREYLEKKAERYKKEKEKIRIFLKEAKEIKTKKGEEMEQNITDPDCRVMKTKDGYMDGYNAQASVSKGNEFIVAPEVTNAANDIDEFQPMLEKIKEMAPSGNEEEIKNAKYLADCGYYSTKNIVSAAEAGIDVYIPDVNDKNYYRDEVEKKDKENERGIGIQDCKITIECGQPELECPGKRVFKNGSLKNNNGMRDYIFRVTSQEECKGCSYYNRCCGALKDKKKRFEISAEKIENWEILERHKQKIRTPIGRQIYSNRMPIIEKKFGQIKATNNFRSFLRRGLEKVRIEWILICSTVNLRRLYTLKYET